MKHIFLIRLLNLMRGRVKMAIVVILVGVLGACGNTLSGVGKDISNMGDTISKWQKSE